MDPLTISILTSLISSGVTQGIPWLMDQFGDSGQRQQGQQGGMNPYDTGTQSPFAEMFAGNPERVAHIPQFTQEQSPLFQLLGQQGRQQLMNPYQGFEDIANQSKQNFLQNTIPSLAERFTSMGKNSLTSPLFATQMGQAGANMNTNLASMKQLYGMQNRTQGLEQLGMALTPQYQNMRLSAQPGMLQGIMPEAMKIGGNLLGAYAKSKWDAPTQKAKG